MNKDRICKLCFGVILGENLKKLDDDVLKMLEILPMGLNGSSIEDGLICLECGDNIKVLFDFKTSSLGNNDYLKTYMEPCNMVKLNLEEIIIKKNTVGIKCEDESVCRFCLNYFDRNLMMELNNEWQDEFLHMLEKCLPEIDLSITENPLMCAKCLKLLENQFKFITKLSNHGLNNVERLDNFHYKGEKISYNNIFEHETKSEDININTHDIKIEKINYESAYLGSIKEEDSEGIEHFDVKIEEFDVKIEEDFSIDQDSKKIINENNISKTLEHSTELSTCSEVEVLYSCTICSHQTNRKHSLNQHYLVHQNPSMVKQYKCDQCSYASKRKSDLKAHSLKHKNPSEITMKKCTECSYKSKYRRTIRQHFKKNHSSERNLQKYKCIDCDYETMERCILKMHYKRRHKKDIELDILNFLCPQCDYNGKSKDDLRRHKKGHIRIHQCTYCEYKTKETRHFKDHMMKHKCIKEVESYSCYECGLKTKYKKNLVKHFKVHRKWKERQSKLNAYESKEIV